MSFLYPSFLWALLALSIPIAIHLFNFRRTKRVYFTNVAFLRTVETQTSSFRKLKQWLVLAARLLALTALILAFAQPFLPSKNADGLAPKGITSFYVDNSYSMQNELDNKRYLDLATGRLSDLLTVFKNIGTLQLLSNDFSAAEQSLNTSEKLRDRLTTLSLSHTPRSLQDVYNRQKNLASKQQGAGDNQFFWFSDFQKSTVGAISELKVDSTDRLFLIPIQHTAEKNLYVDSVWLNTPFIRELQNNILYVKVSNAGSQESRNSVVKLYLDDAQVSTASVTVPASGSATASFNFSLKGKGYKKGRITFDDFPVTFDNDYYFVLNASPLIRIFHIYGQKNPANYIENVYANDSLFAFQSYSVQNVDVGLLKAADLVVLEGVERPIGTLRTELENFVRQGGSLAVIPPAAPDVAQYSSFMGSLGLGGLTVGSSAGAPQLVPLEAPSRQVPFFKDIFEESVRDETNLSLPSVASIWQWSGGGNALLRQRSGQVYLSQGSSGKGQVYLWGSPLATAYGTMGQHALFVPVMYKIAALSARAERTAYTFDEGVLSIQVPEGTATNTIFTLQKDDVKVIPTQRLVGGRLILELPGSDQLSADQSVEAGYYTLTHDNGNAIALLALNHPSTESKLDSYSPDQLRELLAGRPNVKIFDTLNDGDFVREFEQQYVGSTLWKSFLYAALFFLLIEILLIRFMKG